MPSKSFISKTAFTVQFENGTLVNRLDLTVTNLHLNFCTNTNGQQKCYRAVVRQAQQMDANVVYTFCEVLDPFDVRLSWENQ